MNTLNHVQNPAAGTANSQISPSDGEIQGRIKEISSLFKQALDMMETRIVGQEKLGERLLMAMICQGHVLLEGLPGLAKTTTIKALAEVSHLSFQRIQFTPDILPADILGTQIYNPKTANFEVRQGPVFTHLLLADEINRATAKVQSALLEAMQEKQVTLGSTTFPLSDPFLVLATQNPIEQEGTYPLPEAQVDRFLFKVHVTYTSLEDEVEIVKRAMNSWVKEKHSSVSNSGDHASSQLDPVIKDKDIFEAQYILGQIHVEASLREYIVRLVHSTRPSESAASSSRLASLIEVGASPRASIYLERAARAHALMRGRHYVTPQDIKEIAPDILRHRIILNYEAEAEGVSSDQVIQQLLDSVDVP